jgi:hypothetical protein
MDEGPFLVRKSDGALVGANTLAEDDDGFVAWDGRPREHAALRSEQYWL